jgi:CheY-like chemotaxis protein
MDEKTIHILYIEDDHVDFVLMRELLSEEQNWPFSLENAATLGDGLRRLAAGGIDLVLLDLSLPDSHGLTTFTAVKETVRDLPIILMTGLQDEKLALQVVQEGAQDYLVKGEVNTTLLVRAIRYAIEREKLLKNLREALEQIQTLKGLIPICASCKNIRDDKGYWHKVEAYIRQHSGVEFSHGICPECMMKLYPELVKNLPQETNGPEDDQ